MTNYIKAKTKNTQNSKYELCGYNNETEKYIISVCSKISQGEQELSNLGVSVIYWELYDELKFHRTTKLCMHKPELFLENEMHKLCWILRFKCWRYSYGNIYCCQKETRCQKLKPRRDGLPFT